VTVYFRPRKYTAIWRWLAVVSKEVNGDVVTFRVQGSLSGASVEHLEQFWLKTRGKKECHVDLRAAQEIDADGRSLISQMFADGVELVVGTHCPARVQ
jgi:macrodomain Ter protein organizer (MatP/YcbG family)